MKRNEKEEKITKLLSKVFDTDGSKWKFQVKDNFFLFFQYV